MDHAHRRPVSTAGFIRVHEMGFDPCSRGSRSPTCACGPVSLRRYLERVSILVLVGSRSTGTTPGCVPPAIRESAPDPRPSCYAHRPFDIWRPFGCCFHLILVLVDHAHRPSQPGMCVPSQNLFRSLFSWITLTDGGASQFVPPGTPGWFRSSVLVDHAHRHSPMKKIADG